MKFKNWSLDFWLSAFENARDMWGMIMISLMAGIGFIFGMLNMMMWFVEKTGEVPQFFFWIFQGFNVLIYTGIMIFVGIILLKITRLIKEKR